MTSLMRLILKACCLWLILAGIAFAQSDRGTLTGAVTDPAGAVIQGAAVQAKNVPGYRPPFLPSTKTRH